MQSKIAIITGSNRGIGKAAALSLAQNGVDSVITYRSHKDEADAVVAQIRKAGRQAVALQLDVGKMDGFSQFAQTLKTCLKDEWKREDFDFLVNNAGVGHYKLFEETTEAQFDELLNVHFKGAFFLTQKLLPSIKDGGGIINISSGLTRMTYPGSGTYAAMKGAVEVWTRYLAKELGARKIRANIVAPGAIETDFGGGRVRDNKDINASVAGATALGRVGLPEDIGGVIAFLCSPAGQWITAQRIEASGGMNI